MGDLKLAIFLAYKSVFKGNRWALALVVLVMALSFANLLLTPSIMLGVTDTLNRQQVETLYGNIVVDPPAEQYYLNRADKMVDSIEQVPGVAGAAARLDNSAFIEYEWLDKATSSDKGKGGTWPVIGVDPGHESNVTTIPQRITQGSYLDASDRDSIVIGIGIAGGNGSETAEFQTLQGVRVGDAVRVTYPNGVQREYTVKGIFHARESRVDRTAFVTRVEMASVMGRAVYSDRASQILVSIYQSDNESMIIEDMSALGLDAQVRSWTEHGEAAGGIISSFEIVAGLIGGIGLVVAGVVMFIVIYINVIHSRRHIGILRAIGIKKSIIVGSYLTQALFYASAGIVLGGLAFGFGLQVYFERNPLDLSIGHVSLALQAST
ncbi:MAG: ABC transporter permease, partial [Chloroflexota bacterium]